MADQSDVVDVLAGILEGYVYPNGTTQPPAQGVAAITIRGWPLPSQIEKAMALASACVWVYARPEVKDANRYSDDWQTQSIVAATITATVAGNVVTLGGSMPSPFAAHNVFVLLAGKAYGYSVQASDTLSTVAAALASLIAVDYPGTASTGPAITLSTGAVITARVGTTGQVIREIGRLEQMFQIVIAANNPTDRASLGKAITPLLMDTPWLSMPDGMVARMRVRAPIDIDANQKTKIYRRDIKVSVEYAITEVQQAATVEAVNVTTVVNTLNGTTRSY